MTISLLSQSFASIPSSQNPLVTPPNAPTNKPTLRITLTKLPTLTESTEWPQSPPTPTLPLRRAQPPKRAPNPPIHITTPAHAILPFEPPVQSTWRGFSGRIHHRDDDVRDYCAPESYGWMAWQEKRVANSQAEIGKIDRSWGGGRIKDFAEQRRQRRVKARQMVVEWIGGVDEEGWKVDDEEEIVIKDEETVVPDATEEQSHGSLGSVENERAPNDENENEGRKKDEEGGWEKYTDRYLQVMKRWEHVVKESRGKIASAGQVAAAAETRFSETGNDIDTSEILMTF